MTRAREAILVALDAAAGPVTALELRSSASAEMDLATVYRALRWLENHDLVEAFPFACEIRGVERYYVSKRLPHGHFFHCEGCHRFIPVEGCGAENMIHDLEVKYGFSISSHTLYFTGRCADCGSGGQVDRHET